MGWFDGFPFKSFSQMKREQQDFEKRMFPFGMQQRDMALPVLREVLSPKLRDEERLYAFISAKDTFKRFDDADEGLARARKALRRQSRVQPGDIPLILALVQLDDALASLEDYPTPQAVRAAAILLEEP